MSMLLLIAFCFFLSGGKCDITGTSPSPGSVLCLDKQYRLITYYSTDCQPVATIINDDNCYVFDGVKQQCSDLQSDLELFQISFESDTVLIAGVFLVWDNSTTSYPESSTAPTGLEQDSNAPNSLFGSTAPTGLERETPPIEIAYRRRRAAVPVEAETIGWNQSLTTQPVSKDAVTVPTGLEQNSTSIQIQPKLAILLWLRAAVTADTGVTGSTGYNQSLPTSADFKGGLTTPTGLVQESSSPEVKPRWGKRKRAAITENTGVTGSTGYNQSLTSSSVPKEGLTTPTGLVQVSTSSAVKFIWRIWKRAAITENAGVTGSTGYNKTSSASIEGLTTPTGLKQELSSYEIKPKGADDVTGSTGYNQSLTTGSGSIDSLTTSKYPRKKRAAITEDTGVTRSTGYNQSLTTVSAKGLTTPTGLQQKPTSYEAKPRWKRAAVTEYAEGVTESTGYNQNLTTSSGSIDDLTTLTDSYEEEPKYGKKKKVPTATLR